MSISGIELDAAWKNRESVEFDGFKLFSYRDPISLGQKKRVEDHKIR